MTKNPIFCALDTADAEAATKLANALAPHVGGIKLGLEFFAAHGPQGIRKVANGLPVFLDLKLHDIPNTVAGAVRSVLPLEPAMLTVHASGGVEMMRAARTAAGDSPKRPWLLGVTILTSLDQTALPRIGFSGGLADVVKRLADLVLDAGLDGAVCSPLEVAALRTHCGPKFKLVVPGIRPEGSSRDDQQRIMTPKQAMKAGADALVIGRPITGAADPVAAAQAIAAELA